MPGGSLGRRALPAAGATGYSPPSHEPPMRLSRVLLPALLLLAGTAQAKSKKEDPATDGAKAVVAYRNVLMQQMGKSLKLASLVASGQVARPGDLAAYATALQSAPLGELFPAGTGPDDVQTGAKDTVWKDPEGFARAVSAYQAKVAELDAAAKAGDLAAAKAAVEGVGDSCSSCHELYRMED